MLDLIRFLCPRHFARAGLRPDLYMVDWVSYFFLCLISHILFVCVFVYFGEAHVISQLTYTWLIG